MPRIPQDSLDRGVSSDVRAAAPQQDDSLARAIGNLGKTGEALFAKLQQKQNTSDFLDWREDYDNTFREGRSQFIQDLARADLKGDYAYTGTDSNGQQVERAGNVFGDRDSLQMKQSELAAAGDGLALTTEAKRHYTSKENQMGAKLSLDITSHMNKKRRVQVDTKLNSSLNNLLLDIETGIAPTDEDLKAALDKVSDHSMEADVLGSDAIQEKRGRFLASLGQAIVTGVDQQGKNPALDSAISKVSQKLDPRARRRFQVSLMQAEQRFDHKMDQRREKQVKDTNDSVNNLNEYKSQRNGIMPVVKQSLFNGSVTPSKISETLDLLAKSSHMEAVSIGELNVAGLDSSKIAQLKFDEIKDSPVVQEFGEERYKAMLMEQVKANDEALVRQRKQSPSAFLVMYDDQITDKFTSERPDPFGAAERMTTMYDTMTNEDGSVGIARSKRFYAVKPFVDLEKGFFAENANNPMAVLDHVGSLSKGLGKESPLIISQLIKNKGMPAHTFVLQDLGTANRLAVDIATAASQFEDNKKRAGFSAEGDSKRGITQSTLDKKINDLMDDNFDIPRGTDTNSTAMADGMHEAVRAVVYKELTKQFGESGSINSKDVPQLINGVITQFKEEYTPVKGSNGHVVFKTADIKSAATLNMTEPEIVKIMNNPAGLLDTFEVSPNYEKLKESILRKGLPEDSPSVKALNSILQEKRPEDQLRMFKETFGERINIQRIESFSNKIAVTFGDSGRQLPLIINDNDAFTMSDKELFIGMSKNRSDRIHGEIKAIEERLKDSDSTAHPTSRDAFLRMKIKELKNAL